MPGELLKVEGASDERIEMLARRVELLFGFMAELIPDIDLLEQAAGNSASNESYAMSAAPIFGAFNLNHEEAVAKWNLRKRRAEALVNLLKVLRDTEHERLQKKNEDERLSAHRERLLGFMR
jgi:hypothetical protein